MFDKFDEAVKDVLAASRHESMRSRRPDVQPEHVLLALTRDPDNLAARALATMNILSDSILKELEKAAKANAGTDSEADEPEFLTYEDVAFGAQTKRLFERSNDYRRCFGKDRIAPEHVLLAMIDLKDHGALNILEELGVNLIFLRRQVLSFIAKKDCLLPAAPAPKQTVVAGISEVIAEYLDHLEAVQRLAAAAAVAPFKVPERSEVALLVFSAYLPEFLLTQVAYQRYLLEETLRLLQLRTGPLDQETVAFMVSASAQNLRAAARAIIEHLWMQEYRMLSQMPNEAEHEELGSVIEDLWWTYSEEIALHEVFDEAMDDYRRKHVLNLQKRKLEISQRLAKLRSRLEETLKQCFSKRSVSA